MPLAPPMMPQMGPGGPATAPSGNPGEAASAMAQVRTALQILEQGLPKIPIGSDEHNAVIDAIKKLSGAFPPTDEVQGIQSTALLGLQRQAQEGQIMQQLMASMGGGGEAGAPPPGAM